ncbi:hydrophobic protein [Kitasatospora sp. KL5]|uniref:hydrophobic protein n=1 Tax=Kitasatospora sp. KL5 TaxID=3425125 RepID=UPI003D6E211B
MVALLLVLLLILVLFGAGFAVNLLWWVAIALLVVWVIGFFARSGSGGRWYRW